ncbi:hypothetical protein BH11MYX3_BH11MYX3_00440 [soil metagenome]
MRAPLIVIALLSGCWTGAARPARPSPPEPVAASDSDYRATTIAVDALGVAAMAVGLVGLSRGYNEDVSGGILVAGLTAAAYVTPIIHLAHGKKARAGGSLLVRSVTSSTGMMFGLAAGCPEESGLLCGITAMTWGIAGGLAVASTIDAIYFHDREGSARTWTPTIMTGGGGETRLGILGAF